MFCGESRGLRRGGARRRATTKTAKTAKTRVRPSTSHDRVPCSGSATNATPATCTIVPRSPARNKRRRPPAPGGRSRLPPFRSPLPSLLATCPAQTPAPAPSGRRADRDRNTPRPVSRPPAEPPTPHGASVSLARRARAGFPAVQLPHASLPPPPPSPEPRAVVERTLHASARSRERTLRSEERGGARESSLARAKAMAI